MDRNLFPEGVERCSLKKFLVFLGICSVFIIWGLYAMYEIFRYGLVVTALDNYFGFGLWITFDLAIIALGAGAFFSGFLKYILNIKQLENVINLAVVLGFLCYSGAMIALVLDIGQPMRAWFGYWHANIHSMLTEVIFCITVYCVVLIIEAIPLVLEQKQINKIPFCHHLAHNMHLTMALFAGVGAFLSTFHQGSLGGMYGVMQGRPYAYREGFFIWPWTFFLFILSAVASGPVFTMLVATLMEKITGRRLVDYKIKVLLGRIAGTMLAIYMFFKLLDTWAWATDLLPRVGLTFDEMFYGTIYGKWLLWSELFLFGVLPAIILLTPFIRNRPWLLYTAAIFDCIGITINRYVQTVQSLAQPVLPFDKWATYNPNWAEWAPCFLVLAYLALVLGLSYRYLPMFPQERRLNSKQ